MEKEALLKVILNNIKDVETLVQTFNGSSSINPAFLSLTLQKIATIQQEIELLKEVNSIPDETTAASSSPKPIEEVKPSIVSPIDPANEVQNPIIESLAEIKESPTKNIEKPHIEETITIEDDKPSTTEESVEKAKEVPDTKPFIEVNLQERTPQPETKTKSIIGESIGKDKTSVADKIGSNSGEDNNKALIGKPVDDIKKAIGLNDRFLFQRELFEGSANVMSQTLDQINQLTSFEDAKSFLSSNFNWDYENETVDTFIKTVRRKFI